MIADPFRNLVLPVICAPMFLVSGPELVVAACRAGVIGVLPAGNARTTEIFRGWLETFDREFDPRSDAAYACNLSVRNDRAASTRFSDDLQACRDNNVPLIITANGDPAEAVLKVHAWGGLHDVTTMRHAEKAIAVGVDGLIVIGAGGSGHAGIVNPLALIPQIRMIFDGFIVAAGAISNGRVVRAAQVLGADFCYMGTRFIATAESSAPQAYKEMIVAARTSDIVYTPTFTRGVPANFMRPAIQKAGFDPGNLPPPPGPNDSPFEAKPWRDVWAAGQGVGLISDIPHVAELVSRLRREYDEAVANPVRITERSAA